MQHQWWDESEKRKSQKKRSKLKEDQSARKGRKWRNAVFSCFVGLEGRKVGSLKRRVRIHLAGWEMNNCTRLWREAHFEVKVLQSVEMRKSSKQLWCKAHFEVKMLKRPQLRITFGSWDVEKVHAFVVRSRFQSQNVKSTPRRNQFRTLKCRSSVQAQWIFHLHKMQLQERWQAWHVWKGSANMHFAWLAQYTRHLHERYLEVRALMSYGGMNLEHQIFSIAKLI